MLFHLGGHVRPCHTVPWLPHPGYPMAYQIWRPFWITTTWFIEDIVVTTIFGCSVGQCGANPRHLQEALGHPGLPKCQLQNPPRDAVDVSLILYTPVEVARTVLLHGCHGPSCSTQSPFSSPPTDFNLTWSKTLRFPPRNTSTNSNG